MRSILLVVSVIALGAGCASTGGQPKASPAAALEHGSKSGKGIGGGGQAGKGDGQGAGGYKHGSGMGGGLGGGAQQGVGTKNGKAEAEE